MEAGGGREVKGECGRRNVMGSVGQRWKENRQSERE